MSNRMGLILFSTCLAAVFLGVVALVGIKSKAQQRERQAFIARYIEQCTKDNPQYECEMRVELLRAAWRAESSSDTAASMAASGAAMSAVGMITRR